MLSGIVAIDSAYFNFYKVKKVNMKKNNDLCEENNILIELDKRIWQNKLSSLERELSTLGLEKNIIKRR